MAGGRILFLCLLTFAAASLCSCDDDTESEEEK
jgi:hypothetical protein